MRLAIALLFAISLGCMKQPKPDTQEGPNLSKGMQCGEGLQARTIKKGESLLKAPDPLSQVIIFAGEDTPVCATNQSYGQDFHLVKMPDGTQGYVDEQSFYKKS
jgi:hypothetical protein